MTCYAVVTLAALCHYALRKKGFFAHGLFDHDQLNLLLFGGAMFGIVDHWWNKELFMIGPNIMSDLALGFVITISIISVWALAGFFRVSAAPIEVQGK